MSSKKDPDNTMSSSMISLQSSASVANLNPNDRLKCSSGNYAVKVCLNQNCIQKNLFQCLTAQCKCRQLHQKCSLASAQYIRKYVNSKIHDPKPMCDSIDALIDQKIQQLNNLRPILRKLMEEKYSYSKLIGVEKKFLDLVKGSVQLENLTSSESKNLWELAKLDMKDAYNISEQLKNIITTDSNAITNCINSLQSNLTTALSTQETYLKQIPDEIFWRTFDENDLKISQELTKSSAICQTQDLAKSMIKLFGKKLSKVELLFTASKNEFSIKKYFEVCGKVPNTVFVVKTEKDKIIGAYTPLIHDQNNTSNNVADSSKSSFIFSLTDKERFILKETGRTILRNQNRGKIEFGYNQFEIGDKANQKNSCRSDVNYQYYFCPSYTRDNQAAYQKFSGSNARQFKAKEWEVWKVEFAGQNPT